MWKSLRARVILFLLGGCLALPAWAAETYGRLVVFGDSLSDTGNAFVLRGEVEKPPFKLIPDAPYPRGGMTFTNGRTWADFLARDLGLPSDAGPALRGQGPFSNYAIGGARARDAGGPDLSLQVQLALADGVAAGGQPLYVIFVGGNDLRDAVEALAIDPGMATSLDIIDAAVQSIADNMEVLVSHGATHIVVANGPNLGVVPAIVYQGPAVQGVAQYLSETYNLVLEEKLVELEAALPVTVHRMDVFGTVTTAAIFPELYGFTDTSTPCVLAGPNVHAVCPRPDEYLFWDGIHPTEAGHAVLTAAALEAIAAP